MAQIKTPQAFVYMAKIPAAKKIKNIVFRHGVAVSVHDPKVIRLLAKLPYMKVAEGVETPAAKPVKAKAPQAVEIPADWREAHHKRRVSWARAISGAEITTATEANRVIAEHLGVPEVLPEAVVAPVEAQPQAEA